MFKIVYCATYPRTPLASTSAWAVSVSAIDSSLYMPTGVLYCLFTILLTLLPPFWLNGRAELLYPQPMCCSFGGGWCCNDVFVTGPPYCWTGLGIAPVGVTDGFHVEPPRWMVNSNVLPDRTIKSWASLCRKLNASTLFTAITASPGIKPAWSAILPWFT